MLPAGQGCRGLAVGDVNGDQRMDVVTAGDDLFRAPQHPYTKSLLDAVPVPDPESPGGRASVTGEAPSATNPPSGCSFHPRCPHAKDRCRDEVPGERLVGRSAVSCHFAEEWVSARR